MTTTLQPGAFYVLCSGTSGARPWFQATFGAPCDASSSAIAHTGNDAYVLRDIHGGIVDVYGEPGVDGVGQPWFGADGIWRRAASVGAGSAIWRASDWVWSDDLTSGRPHQR